MNRSTDLSICLFFGLAILFAGVNCEFTGWFVKSSDNKICLMVEMDIKTNITYTTKDNKTVFGEYIIPNKNTRVNDESKCTDKEDKLSVSWLEGNFSMKFEQNNGTYDLTNFVININVTKVFNNSAANQTVLIKYVDDGMLFKTQGNFSYHCNREQMLNNTSDNNTITISGVQFEAFRNSNTMIFSLAKDCDSNIKPDIVPIAVGLSLIALIIIVLIAYIVGRRRQQARGYLNIM
ncbi:hypothetical protein PVAND_005794 [Polypedilum vanderplanki]|uniref:Lysosome-associated membrane glycoprotein 5 n=1 Tax=Polypedilum vanderplanki TaxID=319348 RepID=A0A9J6C162_POLVA|nr:hypothetical protein PVAND_005794 [Polypedilum vanderplanki]